MSDQGNGGFVLVSASAPEIFLGCGGSDPEGGAPGQDARFRVVRPQDLFVADIALFNLQKQGTKLVRKNANQAAYVVLHLPRQHILERTADEGADPPQPPVDSSRLSGPSRLVFKAPDGVQEIDHALAALLAAVSSWDLRVALNGTPPPGLEPKGGRFLWVPAKPVTVDLAGNSLPLSLPTSQSLPAAAHTYLRYEPLQQPVLLHRSRVTEGESLEHLVIRSNRGVSSATYVSLPDMAPFAYPVTCERHVAPPKVSQGMVETHGSFDGLWAVEDPATHQASYLLALKEAGTLPKMA